VKNPVVFLRAIGLMEAVSFLVLVGIAMPLKYMAHQPGAVKIAGWVHGILFMAFCGALLRAMVVARWPLARGGLLLIAALLPFGPFLIDKRMKEYVAEFATRVTGGR
jgi:integral membrane protein